MHEYVGTRRVVYRAKDEVEGGAYFVPVCPICSRFVRADKTVKLIPGGSAGPNATCSRHGRVQMPFEGFY